MRLTIAGFLLLAIASALFAAIPPNEFQERRANLQKAVPDGVVILFGAIEDQTADIHYRFFQHPNFLYLTGWSEPGAILLLSPDRQILFLPAHNKRVETFTGPKVAATDPNAREATGFQNVLPIERFESELRSALDQVPAIYADPADPNTKKLELLAPFRAIRPVGPRVTALRMIKSPAEISAIQYTTDVSVEAHKLAWKKTAAGVAEFEVAAVMTAFTRDRGCERDSYPPIIGAGANATILHYDANTRRMDSGDLVLMDAAAECAAYATDITRTIPVNGKFTPRQREIYEIVLGAQQAAIAAIKPGVAYGTNNETGIRKIAYDYINTHGRDLRGEPLGKYFTHGLGHHVGLEVHDPSDASVPLKAGMVLTVEPGIYIPDEKIGVRIEDTVLVTLDGAKVMSSALPRTIADVEAFLARPDK
jgi:Xaa-Pro aminopeptidase